MSFYNSEGARLLRYLRGTQQTDDDIVQNAYTLSKMPQSSTDMVNTQPYGETTVVPEPTTPANTEIPQQSGHSWGSPRQVRPTLPVNTEPPQQSGHGWGSPRRIRPLPSPMTGEYQPRTDHRTPKRLW